MPLRPICTHHYGKLSGRAGKAPATCYAGTNASRLARADTTNVAKAAKLIFLTPL